MFNFLTKSAHFPRLFPSFSEMNYFRRTKETNI